MYVYIKNKLFWDKLFIKNTHTHITTHYYTKHRISTSLSLVYQL